MRLTIAAAIGLIATASATSPSTPRILQGEYTFRSTAMKDGKPVCVERWVFKDGGQTVKSGEEVVRLSFHTEIDADGLNWLVSTLIETNGKPDCTGSSAIPDPGPQKERRTYFLMRNNGAFVVCPPPSKTEDGTPFTGDCWGEATPVANDVR